jgi:hypothetical protein
MFAALNTLAPPLFDRVLTTVLDRDKTWYEHRLHVVEDCVRQQWAHFPVAWAMPTGSMVRSARATF